MQELGQTLTELLAGIGLAAIVIVLLWGQFGRNGNTYYTGPFYKKEDAPRKPNP